MKYKDRKDAALQLVPYLERYRGEPAVLLAIPRGGVPIGYHLALELHFPLELLMTKKIGHPNHPEYAVGAVSMEDHIVNAQLGISPTWITEEVQRIRQDLTDRYARFMGDRPPVSLMDKVVIIVDDGVATGLTILSAIPMLRRQSPAKIVVAVPVAPPDAAVRIREVADDFICPYLPKDFFGVGNHYADFSQVGDEEVVGLLRDMDLPGSI